MFAMAFLVWLYEVLLTWVCYLIAHGCGFVFMNGYCVGLCIIVLLVLFVMSIVVFCLSVRLWFVFVGLLGLCYAVQLAFVC